MGGPGGREPGLRGPGIPGAGGRGTDPVAGAPTRRLPAQPDLNRVPIRPPGSGGSAGSLRQWGSLQGGLGVCLIVASTALGAIVTMVTGRAPGLLLGAFVVIGTIVAALAVRPRAGRIILPVPVLSYLVAALVSGVIYNRGDGASKTVLAIGAAQWIADGFFPMALATALAIVLIAARWLRWRRHRSAAAGPGWTSPVPGQVRRPPQPPVSYRDPGSVRGGGGNAGWNDPASAGPDPGSPGYRRPGPPSGSGPYNFSSGA